MRQSISFIAKLIVVSLLFGVLFSYAMFQGGFVSWFLFYAFLPFLLYMIGVLLYPMNNWKVERKLSKRVATAGETVDVEVTLTRRYPFPIHYCVIEEFFPDSLQRQDTHVEKFRYMNDPESGRYIRKVKRVVFPWFKTKIRYRFSVDKLPRGEHILQAVRVKTGDFFGFVKKEHVYHHDTSLLVFPYQRPVHLHERVYSFEQGSSPSFKLNEKNTNIVTGVREYMPGDRFAWVDWKTTARKNEMMTKEFEQEKSVDMLIILNAVYDPVMSPLSFEGAVEFSASLLDELHQTSSQLGFLTLGDQRSYFPFQKDYSHKQRIQGQLAKIRPIGRTPFAQQLDRERTQLPSGIISMVVSHQLNSDIHQSLLKLAKKCRRLIFFYIRPQEQMSFQDHQLIKQLKNHGILVNVLSEEQLTQREFEVNT
ncbi:DUF58 domain-containing protein [Halobacillus yeomjeoni]|uniref:DUF58 domain-containing protein n=1 Tax=Halobacillus yeomjeoni TaxID=311194 RepID=UPI001CD68884|nr:DUF58 domain-containing protein [Halobacillus yeomjeoni]MCA0984402.1 DUF58 domain-containing protein [Halobacillus yeomjeoni]